MRSLTKHRWRSGSLRRTLLVLLIPFMLLVFCFSLLQTWRIANEAANAAYDRSLFGAIKSIDANISTGSGGLGVELPYRMLEFFELTAAGAVYYRVATEDGLAEIGSSDLPKPPPGLKSGQPEFRDAVYYGEPVRVGSFARVMSPALAGQTASQRVVIQVVESATARAEFRRALVVKAATRDALVLLLASMLVVAGVAWTLQPLRALRQGVAARAPEDLTPVPLEGIPKDVRPLVDAINVHMERNHQQAVTMRNFIDDASHQLRTPLTTLSTQVSFALRESNPLEATQTLRSIKVQLDDTIRQTNQMLSLARADSAQLAFEPLDLNALAESIAREWWPQARQRGLDLGFDGAPAPALIEADRGLVREMLSNLLHNALEHTPGQGHVTVVVRTELKQVLLEVIDTGRGIPPEEISRAGERFFRASNARRAGSGLGLAIVGAIMQRHGGTMQLCSGPQDQGLRVVLRFRAAQFPS
jgi:two-component system, OmpR family, sensor histidine kinase TctE